MQIILSDMAMDSADVTRTHLQYACADIIYLFPCAGCLYADNIERANLFKVVLKKANGEKRLEQAYMREYLKRKLGKKKNSLIVVTRSCTVVCHFSRVHATWE